MNEEEKKAIKILKEIEINTYAEGKAIAIDTALKLIKKLQKENEEYMKAIDVVNKEKADWIKAYQEEKDKQFDLINKISSNDSIQKQKVKDKIEEYKNVLKTCNKAKYIDRIKAINERILELQELLEGRK